MVLETQRLLLREMNQDDFQALSRVLGDPKTMWHYPYTSDGQHIRNWIERNMNRYREDGFGLWAVCLKDNEIGTPMIPEAQYAAIMNRGMG